MCNEEQKRKRMFEEQYNKNGCLMKIVEYNNARNIVVQFQDKYLCKVRCEYSQFKDGRVSNPYFPSVYSHGMIGEKYKCKVDGKDSREYSTWHSMLSRCFDEKYLYARSTYKDVTCSDEWLLFDNFYEWLHSQENFDNWISDKRGCLDKDILVKGNKLYSPDNCCLVPNRVNVLFTKRVNYRGNTPIGVSYHKRDNIYEAHCNDGNGKPQYLGRFSNQTDAFNEYKKYKENLIKTIANEEYEIGNITKKCFDAMNNYVVEITD